MATQDAIIQKRVDAVERIKRAMPGLVLPPYPRGGPEFQHAADLEAIADALEAKQSKQGETSQSKKGD